MKKLLLLLLVTTSFFISANREKLENAIMESDLSAVRSLLKETTLEENERYSLYKLSKKILRQRRSLFSFVFPSNEQLKHVLMTLGISGTLSLIAAGMYEDSHRQGLFPFVLRYFVGLALFPAIVIKNFYDFRRWTNAIVIKTLLEKKENLLGEK